MGLIKLIISYCNVWDEHVRNYLKNDVLYSVCKSWCMELRELVEEIRKGIAEIKELKPCHEGWL